MDLLNDKRYNKKNMLVKSLFCNVKRWQISSLGICLAESYINLLDWMDGWIMRTDEKNIEQVVYFYIPSVIYIFIILYFLSRVKLIFDLVEVVMISHAGT